MDNRILPSERIKQEVQWVLWGQEAVGHPLDRLVHLGAQYLLQRALEDEVQEFLGRGTAAPEGRAVAGATGMSPRGSRLPLGC